MSGTVPLGSGKAIAVTVLGMLTLLLGIAYSALGCGLIFAGSALRVPLQVGDPAGGFAFLLWLLGAIVTLIAVIFLLQGILGLLAGCGILQRKQWGRILAFILAVLAALWGLVWVSGTERTATDIAVGAVQILYGFLAFVILIKNGADFSRTAPTR